MEKFWKTKLKEPKACEIEKGFTCIAMQGYRRFEDYYLIIPEKGIFFRTANSSRYGEYKYELFIDGFFIGATPIYKKDKLIEMYNAGHILDAQEYSQGYKLYRETVLGGNKINKYKEAARISHLIAPYGSHEERQQIRRLLLRGEMVDGFKL